MSNFPVHSRESAPEASHATLDAVATMFGFVPNLLGVMATSPALMVRTSADLACYSTSLFHF